MYLLPAPVVLNKNIKKHLDSTTSAHFAAHWNRFYAFLCTFSLRYTKIMVMSYDIPKGSVLIKRISLTSKEIRVGEILSFTHYFT